MRIARKTIAMKGDPGPDALPVEEWFSSAPKHVRAEALEVARDYQQLQRQSEHRTPERKRGEAVSVKKSGGDLRQSDEDAYDEDVALEEGLSEEDMAEVEGVLRELPFVTETPAHEALTRAVHRGSVAALERMGRFPVVLQLEDIPEEKAELVGVIGEDQVATLEAISSNLPLKVHLTLEEQESVALISQNLQNLRELKTMLTSVLNRQNVDSSASLEAKMRQLAAGVPLHSLAYLESCFGFITQRPSSYTRSFNEQTADPSLPVQFMATEVYGTIDGNTEYPSNYSRIKSKPRHKVWMKVKLGPVECSDEVKAKIVEIAGRRYRSQLDEVWLTCDAYDDMVRNKQEVEEQWQRLVQEARDAQ